MKVLGIGESVIDTAYITDKKIEEKHIGGPSLIAMLLLSRLDIECTLLTTLGRDAEAEIIKKALKNERVHMIAKIEKHTKVNKYRIDPTNGSREKLRGNVIHPPIKHIERSLIRQFDAIIIDRHEPLAFYEILQKKKPETKIIIDPSTEVSNLTMAMIQYADYPIIPIEALVQIGSSNNLSVCLEKIYSIARKTVVITAGELGSIIYDGNHCELIPTLRVKAVDVQGAGDIYRGAFAYGILHNWGIKKSVSYANKVAALHCTKLGNAAAVPTKNEIDELSISLNAKEISVPTMGHYASLQ